ncbi:MAG: dihydropteroate synthase [Methylacidiphilales bacterium]|nr:dihydropteroate synthase [Candidatus Methylacidiphilales bacterium]
MVTLLKFLKGTQLTLPTIMGVVNCTPDSFSENGVVKTVDMAVSYALELIEEGASIIDIGGESTRPGAKSISTEEERARIEPVLNILRKKTQAIISIDTQKPEIMKIAQELGADIINDVSGFANLESINFAKQTKLHLIVSHMQGTPISMQYNPQYSGHVINVIKSYFTHTIQKLEEAGVSRNQIIIDPGIGFGKTFDHNMQIITNINELMSFDLPICIGLSRKSLNKTLLQLSNNDPIAHRLPSTLLLTQVSLAQGAGIFRTHDVGVTKRWITAIEEYKMWFNKSNQQL